MVRQCQECGGAIPDQARRNAVVCSSICRVARKNRLTLERYHRVKGTPEYQRQQREKYEQLKEEMAADPGFAKEERARRAAAVKRFESRAMQDPAYRAKKNARHLEEQKRYLKRKREKEF